MLKSLGPSRSSLSGGVGFAMRLLTIVALLPHLAHIHIYFAISIPGLLQGFSSSSSSSFFFFSSPSNRASISSPLSPLVSASWTFQHKICSSDLQYTDPEGTYMKVDSLLLAQSIISNDFLCHVQRLSLTI